MVLPNFLMIGAQRCGTTLLHAIFSQHDEVFVPTRRKEVHYFDRFYDRGLAWYEEFFPDSDDADRYRAIGEITPDYLSEPEVPARIAETLSDCRFLVSVRDPIRRAFSWYLFAKRSHNEQRSFSDFIRTDERVLRAGRYAEQLKRYHESFPKERFHVVVYEDLVAEPAPVLDGIAGFLGLSRSWDDAESLMTKRINPGVVPRFPRAFYAARQIGIFLTRHDLDGVVNAVKRVGGVELFGKSGDKETMSEQDRAYLSNYYAGDIDELAGMLGSDLVRWQGDRAA